MEDFTDSTKKKKKSSWEICHGYARFVSDEENGCCFRLNYSIQQNDRHWM